MKVTIYFNKQRTKADGNIPISLVVTRGKDRFYINTGLSSKTVFDSEIFPRSEKNFRAKTIKLQQMITDAEDILLRNSLAPTERLKEMIKKKVLGIDVKDKKTLYDYLIDYSRQSRREMTKKTYLFTAKMIQEYDCTADLSIGVSWLEKLQLSLLKRMKINSVSIHLRNIRTVFNWAIRNDITENYPFRKFRIPSETTIKRNLSIDTIKEIRDKELKGAQAKYRDVFMLMFYLIGINGVDLLNAKKNQVVNGRLVYRRAKTHKIYSVLLEPEALEIIERYKGNINLLSFCEYSDYIVFMSHMNQQLKKIISGISTYYARHSWATIAYSLDISKDIISQALGHSIGSEITSIYIEYDQNKVDIANRKVLDALL